MKLKKFKPFSDNVVFFDTEFSSNDSYIGEILSIGMVKMSGEELYLEFEYDGPISDWVKENIWDELKEPKVSKYKARALIDEFLGDKEPFLISNIISFDTVYLYKVFEFGKTNFKQFPIDLSSVLFTLGENPYSFVGDENKRNFCHKLGIDLSDYRMHNALDDARLLREVYLKMIG